MMIRFDANNVRRPEIFHDHELLHIGGRFYSIRLLPAKHDETAVEVPLDFAMETVPSWRLPLEQVRLLVSQGYAVVVPAAAGRQVSRVCELLAASLVAKYRRPKPTPQIFFARISELTWCGALFTGDLLEAVPSSAPVPEA